MIRTPGRIYVGKDILVSGHRGTGCAPADPDLAFRDRKYMAFSQNPVPQHDAITTRPLRLTAFVTTVTEPVLM